MTGRKAVFLDVDGTLADERGMVPGSAVAAVREARERGHAVFLCTGRSHAELWPALWAIGFDGSVTASGAYVETGGRVLVHRTVPPADLRHARDFFDAHRIDAYFQAHAAVYASGGVRDHMRALLRERTDPARPSVLERGPFAFVDRIDTLTDPTTAPITKVMYLRAHLAPAQIVAEFAGTFHIVPSSVDSFGGTSGEMMVPGVHKASGIATLIGHLGIDRADTLALGDSDNDLEMLAEVAVGIAMGNASAVVKDVADEVTGSVDHHGVRDAFRRHGLID